uniref:Uncharacterized protein n=1 Tax=Peronospora matthiolae TaxID=2874970 RepID=A0AAV1TBG0_9STRA
MWVAVRRNSSIQHAITEILGWEVAGKTASDERRRFERVAGYMCLPSKSREKGKRGDNGLICDVL